MGATFKAALTFVELQTLCQYSTLLHLDVSVCPCGNYVGHHAIAMTFAVRKVLTCR